MSTYVGVRHSHQIGKQLIYSFPYLYSTLIVDFTTPSLEISEVLPVFQMAIKPIMPHKGLIQAVMKECGCSRSRAIELLKICNNDVDQALKHHRLLESYTQVHVSQGDYSPPSEKTFTWDSAQSNPSSKNPSRSPSKSAASHKASSDMGSENNAQDSTARSDESSRPKEWDFALPRLPLLEILEKDDYSPDSLASVIQRGDVTVQKVEDYLKEYDPLFLKRDIIANVMGFPLIFYAVESNDVNMVRLLIRFGASASAVYEAYRVPLLAFAIMCGETLQADTTNMVSLLLSKGASPYVIPMDLFTEYLVDMEKRIDQQKGSPPVDKPAAAAEAAWCSQATRDRLAKNLNLTQRYFLEKSTKTKRPSAKRKQVARIKDCEGLLGLPYFLVGQNVATELLIQRLLTHLTMPPTKAPLVLCFAGPSGHGKTELARQLGRLLSLPLEVVDCTTFSDDREMFGTWPGWTASGTGSALNNFLAQNNGKPCIVFLDEFEKTTAKVHQSLLLPFGNGEYQDRRSRSKIDCSNTIWILATNALDETIMDFCEHNDTIASDNADERRQPVRDLCSQLKEKIIHKFGAPVTGRISDFVPLLPFTAGEQAVITHKCLLELARNLRQPIKLTEGCERLIGDMRLLIRRDGTVCSTLAKQHYHNKLGARSLEIGAETVKRILLDAYLDDDEEIEEQEKLRDAVIDLDGKDIVGRILPLAKTKV
ncbi:P-loop containing nucleoside triphosphate hydrolase protein [Trichoderma gracile]